jgi:hypothetical protein
MNYKIKTLGIDFPRRGVSSMMMRARIEGWRRPLADRRRAAPSRCRCSGSRRQLGIDRQILIQRYRPRA